jgi:hypothetical protein
MIRTPQSLRWAEDFICCGLSALLLLLEQVSTLSLPLSLVALLPYFRRLTGSATWRSVLMGAEVASCYVFVAYGNNLAEAPLTFVGQFLGFNLIFTIHGFLACRTKRLLNRRLYLLICFWLVLEYGLSHAGGNLGLLGAVWGSQGLSQRLVWLASALILHLIYLLLNPLLRTYAVHLLRNGSYSRRYIGSGVAAGLIQWQVYFPSKFLYLIPGLRSPPPGSSQIVGSDGDRLAWFPERMWGHGV